MNALEREQLYRRLNLLQSDLTAAQNAEAKQHTRANFWEAVSVSLAVALVLSWINWGVSTC